MSKSQKQFFYFVQIATICVFVGRAYQHVFWDAPFRSIFWSEDWMSEVVTTFTGMTWSEYVRSPEMDKVIQNLIQWNGYFYLICALLSIFINKIPLWGKRILLLGSLSLSFLSFLYMKEKWFHFGQFFEYSLQVCSPIFLYLLATRKKLPNGKMINIMKVIIGVTFVCHGLYALNYYPRPGDFIQMVINITGLGEGGAIQFLDIAGVLDIVVAIGILFPRKIAISVLIYACIWGFGTTIARVWANCYFGSFTSDLHQWGWESIVRFPHFCIPIAVLIFVYHKNENDINPLADK